MKSFIGLALLSLLVLGSALGVVDAKHQSRKYFVELSSLQQTRDAMNVEWGQLQLEQSTWATHGRIERTARKRLNMMNLDLSRVVIVKP